MIRVAVVSEIPTPYRQPIFARLIDHPTIDFQFFFLSASQPDRQWNVERLPDLPGGILPSRQICIKGRHTIHFNFGGKRRLTAHPFDVYVLAGYAQPLLFSMLRYCWRKRIPYITWTESHHRKARASWWKRLKQPYLQRVYGRGAAHLVMGSAAEAFVRSYGAQEGSTFYVPNSIDGPSFSRAVEKESVRQAEIRAGIGIRTPLVILFVGALIERKGVHLLLEAFGRATAGRNDVSLVLAGQGALRGSLEIAARKHGFQGRVIFPGFIQPENLPALYAAADLFVLPSLEEPFGAVLCEAMAASLPAIVSDAVGASADFVVPGETGIIVPAGTTRPLSDALIYLLNDASARNKMGARARTLMEAWSHDKMAASIVDAVRLAHLQ